MATFEEIRARAEKKRKNARVLAGIATVLGAPSLLSFMTALSLSGDFKDEYLIAKGEKEGFMSSICVSPDYKAHVAEEKKIADKSLENGEMSYKEYLEAISPYYTTNHAEEWLESECTDTSLVQLAKEYDEKVNDKFEDYGKLAEIGLAGFGGLAVSAGLAVGGYKLNKRAKKEELDERAL